MHTIKTNAKLYSAFINKINLGGIAPLHPSVHLTAAELSLTTYMQLLIKADIIQSCSPEVKQTFIKTRTWTSDGTSSNYRNKSSCKRF